MSRNVFEISTPLTNDTVSFKEQEHDVTITGEFVAGLISKELLSTFKIPIFMTLVTKNDFIEL